MNFNDWITAHPRGRVTIIAGGEPADFRAWILESVATKINVFASSADAGGYAVAFPAVATARLAATISRGIEFDLRGMKRGGPPCVFSGPATDITIREDAQRILNRVQIVSGYTIDPTMASDMAAERVARALTEYVPLGLPSIVLHDPQHLLASRAPRGVDVQIGSPALGNDRVETPAPVAGQVLGHADFLVRTDEATLLQMHAFLARYSRSPIMSFWRGQLRKHRAVPGYELMIEIAIERLDALERALERDAAATALD